MNYIRFVALFISLRDLLFVLHINVAGNSKTAACQRF